MKLKLGDKVKFVSDNLEGVITDIKANLYYVTIEDDFAIPTVASDLIKMEDTPFNQKQESKAPAPKTNLVKVYDGVHMAFERVTDTVLQLKLHNSSSDFIQFACYEKVKNEYTLIQQGELELEKNVFIKQYNLDEINKLPILAFQINYVYLTTEKLKMPLFKELNISAKEFHQSFGQCYFLGKQAYHFRLDQHVPVSNINKLLEKDFSEPVQKVIEYKPVILDDEIDLHYKPSENPGLAIDPMQIMEMQLKWAQQYIDNSYAAGLKRVIVIHGVGNNWLKNKIQQLLRKQSFVRRFVPAEAIKYGDGATEVFFKE
jgi:hypothetical protein